MSDEPLEPIEAEDIPKTKPGSDKSGGPLTDNEVFLQRLSLDPNAVKEELKRRVIGQEEAIEIFVDGLSAQNINVRHERPASFLFLGPTGVGKNYLVEQAREVIAEQGFITDSRLVFGPQFSSKHNVSSLLGSPPGYVGCEIPPVFELADQECEKSHVYFLIFDEFEKGHRAMHDLILGLTDTGITGLAQNGEADLRRSVMVMTSNAGYSDVELQREQIGFDDRGSETGLVAKEFVRRHFSPELLGRVSQIHFRKLDEEETYQVASRELDKLVEKTATVGLELLLSDGVTEVVMEASNWRRYGCRDIRNTAARLVGNQVNQKAQVVLQQIYGILKEDESVDIKPHRMQVDEIVRYVRFSNIAIEVTRLGDGVKVGLSQQANK